MAENCLKVLLVEDEPLTREMLLMQIPWHEYGASSIFQASNGSDGLKTAGIHTPDLILTDIRMPLMNGIDFISDLRKINQSCRVIFISAYCDKSTLKDAILLEAADFIEKPIDFPSLNKIVQRALKKCMQTKITMEYQETAQKFLTYQDNAGIIRASLLQPMSPEANPLYDLGIDPKHVYAVKLSDSFYDSAQTASLAKELSALLPHPLFIAAWEEKTLLFLSNMPLSVNLPHALNQFAVCHHVSIGSSACTSMNRLEQAILEANEAAGLNFYSPDCFLFRHYTSTPPVFSEGLLVQLQNAIAELDAHKAAQCLRRVCAELKADNPCCIGKVRDIYIWMIREIARSMKKKIFCDYTEDFMIRDITSITRCTSLLQAEEIVRKRLLAANALFHGNDYSKPISGSMDFVLKHYMQPDLSIHQIAKHVFLSDAYLCAAFKKETGRTLHQYIEQIRMQKAKQLMAEHAPNMTEIALQTGFTNPNYFAKVFRKMTGCSPTVYRKRLFMTRPDHAGADEQI